MSVKYSGISWTDHTMNAWRHCEKITSGCTFCYAERISLARGEDFSVPVYSDIPISKLAKSLSKPVLGTNGLFYPARVFVNSMSDAFWQKIPDEKRDDLFSVLGKYPDVCWQILTKRDTEMVRYITSRYSKDNPLPPQIWLGVSVESDRYVSRLDALRVLKEQAGLQVAFVSFEPLLGSVKSANLNEIDWAIIGGESYGDERLFRPQRAMTEEHARETINLVDEARIPLHFKQWGTWAANPYFADAVGNSLDAKIRWLQAKGMEAEPPEPHGGCMIRLNGEFTLRQEQPAAFHEMTERVREKIFRPVQELATPPATPLPTLEAVMTTLSTESAFDLRQAEEVIKTAYRLSDHHVRWRKIGATKSEFGRLVLLAILKLEDAGHCTWNKDRAEWIRTAA